MYQLSGDVHSYVSLMIFCLKILCSKLTCTAQPPAHYRHPYSQQVSHQFWSSWKTMPQSSPKTLPKRRSSPISHLTFNKTKVENLVRWFIFHHAVWGESKINVLDTKSKLRVS